jgi:hypothetical protein
MLKVPITYEDFDGKTVTKDFYFHLGINSIIKMEDEARKEMGLSDDSDMGSAIAAFVQREMDTKDTLRILKVLGKFIDKGYGKRTSEDGFDQSPEISSQFASSLAFDAFFMNLMMNEGAAVKFVTGMMPAQLRDSKEFSKELKKAGLAEGLIDSEPPKKVVSTVALPESDFRDVPSMPELQEGLEEDVDPEFDRMREDVLSGLKRPRDARGALLPWAFKEPTLEQLRKMTRAQFADVMRRKASGEWEPSIGG